MENALGNDFYITDFITALRVLKSKTGVTVANRHRNHFALVLKKSGCTVYTFNNCDYISDCCHPIILPKGSQYTWVCTQTGECIIFEFECNLKTKDPIRFYIKDSEFIETAFNKIEKRSMQNTLSSKLKNMRELYGVLSVLCDADRVYSNSKADIIKPALDYMAQNYYIPNITNDTLSAMLGISTVYFRRLFKECYGISPIAYLNEIRIKKAQELLNSDYTSIEQISSNVGYNSVYHFSKMFKLKTGMSPSRYASEPSAVVTT